MAHIDEIVEKERIVPMHTRSLCGDKDLDSTTCTSPNELQLVDLYTVGSEELEEFKIHPLPEVPFVHRITVNGAHGCIIHIRGVSSSSAMVNAMCSTVYDKIKHRLSLLQPSSR